MGRFEDSDFIVIINLDMKVGICRIELFLLRVFFILHGLLIFVYVCFKSRSNSQIYSSNEIISLGGYTSFLFNILIIDPNITTRKKDEHCRGASELIQFKR